VVWRLDILFSLAVTLVENEPLSVCKLDIAVTLLLLVTSLAVTRVLKEPLSVCKLDILVSLAVTLVLNDPEATCKLDILAEFALMLTAKEPDKLEVAAFSSASVANVASSEELNDSKPVTLVENEPLATCKLDILAEFALMLTAREPDKLEVAAFSSASVANVASKDELNDSKPVNRVAKEAEPFTLDSST
jgi:hypothetical protein